MITSRLQREYQEKELSVILLTFSDYLDFCRYGSPTYVLEKLDVCLIYVMGTDDCMDRFRVL